MSEHELLSLYDAARPLASRHGSRPGTRGGKSRDDDDGLDHSLQGNSGSKYRHSDGEMAGHADSSTAAAINIYGKAAHPPRTPQRTKALATPNRSKRAPAGDDENNPSGDINGASNSDRASKTTGADKKPQTPPTTASNDRALSRLAAQQGRPNRAPGTPPPKTPTSQAKRTAVNSSTSGSAYKSPAAASSDRQGTSKSTSRGGSRTPTQTKRVTGNISAASLLYQINQPTAPACTYTGAAAPAQAAPGSPSAGLSGMAPSGETSVSSDSPAWRHQARLVGTAGSPKQEPPRANSREYLSGQLRREKAAKKEGEAPAPKTAGQAQRKSASMAPPNNKSETPSETPQGGGYVNMSLQDYMASLLTTPAESNTNNGLGSTCESWAKLDAQPGSDDDDMIMPPDYNESSDSEDEVADGSTVPRPSRPSVTFGGPLELPKGGASEGAGSHRTTQATRSGGPNASPRRNPMASFTNESPAAGNAYDLRPATEGGSRSAAGGVETSSTASDTKQVDLAEMSGALFSPKDAQPRAQAQDRRMLKVGEQTLRVSSAHARAEGVATDLERPPSRQKPPPEALHLFAETGMGNIASNLGQNYAPTMDRPMTTMNSQSRSRSARAELGPTAKEAVASASTLSRPPSRQRPPPESLCLEFPPADDEMYREIFHDSSDEEDAA
ncbi:hypothetical protein CYMTET_17976 [Cymbomonas tetramitiformis]|uniref:Uncharacterized protein n=1 Tax=Cymbomonas tetramitiformis TaxID=36881 RepID=A0AAE0GAB5_9CHLO|nr:hypothetical protein CYMTET_17976 [Cymbomonas tetramitiformis]